MRTLTGPHSPGELPPPLPGAEAVLELGCRLCSSWYEPPSLDGPALLRQVLGGQRAVRVNRLEVLIKLEIDLEREQRAWSRGMPGFAELRRAYTSARAARREYWRAWVLPEIEQLRKAWAALKAA